MDAIYAQGLTYFPPRPMAKEWDKGQLSIHLDQLSEWLISMQRDTDENGRIRLDIVEQKSRPGKFSIKLNTYKKQERASEPKSEDDDERLPW